MQHKHMADKSKEMSVAWRLSGKIKEQHRQNVWMLLKLLLKTQ